MPGGRGRIRRQGAWCSNMDLLTGRFVAPSGARANLFARGPSPEDTGKLALAHAAEPSPSGYY